MMSCVSFSHHSWVPAHNKRVPAHYSGGCVLISRGRAPRAHFELLLRTGIPIMRRYQCGGRALLCFALLQPQSCTGKPISLQSCIGIPIRRDMLLSFAQCAACICSTTQACRRSVLHHAAMADGDELNCPWLFARFILAYRRVSHIRP